MGIGKEDIQEYLESYSDFAFELKVLELLNALDLRCSHSGTYRDPITKHTREYDIRAEYRSRHSRILISVECKNLSADHPLILHCLQRSNSEAYQDYMVGLTRSRGMGEVLEPPVVVKRFGAGNSPYSPLDLVAKSTDQIYRHSKSKEIKTGDGAVFGKISQAINASYELIERAYEANPGETFCIWPILVVPKNTIWAIRYKKDGSVVGEPYLTDQMSYFIGKTWTVPSGESFHKVDYTLSHLDIVTITSVEDFMKEIVLSDNSIRRFG